MLSGQGKFADILLSEVNQLDGIDLVQVYDKEGMYVAFGNDDREVDEAMKDGGWQLSSNEGWWDQITDDQDVLSLEAKAQLKDYGLELAA